MPTTKSPEVPNRRHAEAVYGCTSCRHRSHSIGEANAHDRAFHPETIRTMKVLRDPATVKAGAQVNQGKVTAVRLTATAVVMTVTRPTGKSTTVRHPRTRSLVTWVR